MSRVHDATSLLADRRRRGRRRRWLVALAVVLVLAVVGGGVAMLYRSSTFHLARVTVTGASVVPAEEVLRVANAPLGRPLVTVAERPIAERVATMPQVRTVTVTRAWPNAITVAVTERTPAYAVEVDGAWQLVDAGGIPYLQVPDRPADLVAARAPTNDAQLLEGLARVTAALSPQLREGLERVEAKSADTVTLKFAGREVLLGSSADIELKLRVAQSLLQGTKAAWIDVSAPGHPATR